MINKIRIMFAFLCFLFLLSGKSIAATLTIEDQPFKEMSIYTRGDAFEFYEKMHPVLTDWKDNHQDTFVKNWSIIVFSTIFIDDIALQNVQRLQNLSNVISLLQSNSLSQISDTTINNIREIIKIFLKMDSNLVNFDPAGIDLFLKLFKEERENRNLNSSNLYFSFLENLFLYLKSLLLSNDFDSIQLQDEIIFSALSMNEKALKIVKAFSMDIFEFIEERTKILTDTPSQEFFKRLSATSLFEVNFIFDTLKLRLENFDKINSLIKKQFNNLKLKCYNNLSSDGKLFYEGLRESIDDYYTEKKLLRQNLLNYYDLYNQIVFHFFYELGVFLTWFFSDSKYDLSQKLSFSATSLLVSITLITNAMKCYAEKKTYIASDFDIDICCFYFTLQREKHWTLKGKLKNEIILFVESSSYDKSKTFFDNVTTFIKGDL